MNPFESPVVTLITFFLIGSGLIIAIIGVIFMLKKGLLPSTRAEVSKDKLVVMSSSPEFWIFICGMLFALLIYYFYLNAGVDSHTRTDIFFQKAFAQEDSTNDALQLVEGWVYLGPGGKPETWRFEFLRSGLEKIGKPNEKIIVRAKREMPIREKHFGNFTGTFLQFLSPEPKIVGRILATQCAKVIEYKSVGVNKIWLHIEPANCPIPK